jgi:ribosomal protein S18 acetylase RimI-like enzyme
MDALRIGIGDLAWSTQLLADAFDGKAPAAQLFRAPNARAKLVYFMACSARYALLYGEGYATAERSGAAFWLLPDATSMTPGRMYRAGMFAAPLRLGLRDLRAFGAFATHTDRVHRQAVPGPHYYLLALGVHPEAQGKGVGPRLIAGMLERAERERLPVYLETQSPENVVLYERMGFSVASDEPIARTTLRNWGMIKR